MVGAFKLDSALPLLARVPRRTAFDRLEERRSFKDIGIRFPTGIQKAEVAKRAASRGAQTLISFFADPSFEPVEQERVIAATTVLETVAP